jgi:hypothetical protein
MKWFRPVAVVLAAAAILAAAPVFAADDPGVIPLRIQLGDTTPVGPGPVRNLICDDASLVKPVDVGGAPALKGMAVGTTLCSLTDALATRRVYRVVVFDQPSAPRGGAAAPGSGG